MAQYNKTNLIDVTLLGKYDTKIKEYLKAEDKKISDLVGAIPEGATATTVTGYAKELADAISDDLGTAAAADVATVAIGSEGETTTALPTVAQVETYVAAEISGLEGAMHFRGVITRNEGETDAEAIARVITSPEAGDVVVMSDNAKEYIYANSKWSEVGDETEFVKKTTTIAGKALTADITKADMLSALNVADGAQVNVLEGVQVNGTDLTATDKKVNVTVATGSANGSIAVNGTDVAVKGLDSAAYVTVDSLNTTAKGYADAVQGDTTGTVKSVEDAIGKAKEGETAGTGLTGRIEVLEAAIGESGSVATQIKAAVEALDSEVTNQIAPTEEVPSPTQPDVIVKVTETDGKLTSVVASVTAERFEAYGAAAAVQGDTTATIADVKATADTAVQPADILLAEESEILALFSTSGS